MDRLNKIQKLVLTSVLTLLVSLIILLSACSKNESSNQVLSDVPQAIAKFDNSDSGIYKGIVLGSKGTITIDCFSSGNEVSAELTIDGKTLFFTSDNGTKNSVGIKYKFVSGSNHFDLQFNKSKKFTGIFSNIFIEGHPNVKIVLSKEFSDKQVRCYAGTYAGGDQGTILGMSHGDRIEAMFMSDNDPNKQKFTADGEFVNSKFTIGGTSTGSVFVGDQFGDRISGSWTNKQLKIEGSFSAIRTL